MHFVKAKGLLSAQNGINVYRGCTHGCIYCDSRSLCYGFTHRFEDIEVKENAPELLEKALLSKRKKCVIGTGAMCDPYMPCEKELNITRTCLELIDKYGFGLAVQTKSDLILRDCDLLSSINKKAKCVVQMTLTTGDEELCAKIEPNVCTTKRRFDALCRMQALGIPTVVWLSPVLPFINDTEENLLSVLSYCKGAGVRGILCFNIGVTLRDGDREYFYAALDRLFPGMKQKYIKAFGNSYECISPENDRLMRIFTDFCKSENIMYNIDEIFSYLRSFPSEPKATQLSFF